MRFFSGLRSFASSNYFAFCAIMLILLYSGSVAFAAAPSASSNDALTQALCAAIGLVQGAPGKAIAIIVIISVALGMFFGKVSWALGIMICVAMGILFGAETVVQTITGNTAAICPPGTT